MTTSKTLVSISTQTSNSLQDNLSSFVQNILSSPKDSIILAPEVAISNFCYDEIDKASDYAQIIKSKISQVSASKTICLTIIEKEKDKYFNNAYIFHNQQIVYKRAKNILFNLGDEHLYFSINKHQSSFGKYENIINIDGLKIGVLICFELRFTDEWKKLLGCDIILIPAQWGLNRINHFKTLSNALALTNQCFVVNSNNANLSKCNQVITPFGEVMESSDVVNIADVDLLQIKKIRKYIVLN